MMTEKQAWIFLAEEFEKEFETPYNDWGLCDGVWGLYTDKVVDKTTRSIMYARILKYKIHISADRNFIYPPMPEYKPHRAALARKFAEECE